MAVVVPGRAGARKDDPRLRGRALNTWGRIVRRAKRPLNVVGRQPKFSATQSWMAAVYHNRERRRSRL